MSVVWMAPMKVSSVKSKRECVHMSPRAVQLAVRHFRLELLQVVHVTRRCLWHVLALYLDDLAL